MDGCVAPEEVHGILQRAAPGQLDGVEATIFLQHPGDLDALVDPQPAGHAVGHVELGGDSQPVAHGVADSPDNGAWEPGPVLERAAPLIGAAVELGAEELAGEVAVAQVYLDGVEPAVGDDPRRTAEVVGDAGDVLRGDRPGALHRQGTEHGRGRQPAMPGGRGHGARVADLGGDGRPFAVDHVGQPLQPRDGPRSEDDLVGCAAAVGGDGAVGDRRHPHAAGRHPAVELDQPIADDVLARGPFEGGRLHDAVAQPDGAKGGRAEGVGHVVHGPPILTR